MPMPLKEVGKHRVVDMALGPTHSAVLVETGQLYTFGRNSEGQLCSGNCLPRNTPVLVKGLQSKPTVSMCMHNLVGIVDTCTSLPEQEAAATSKFVRKR